MSRIHIRVTRHSAFYSPLILTLAGNYLREEGLEPSYDVVTPALTVADGIRDGTVQVAQSAPATNFGFIERGETPPHMHFAQINERDGFFLVGRRPEPDFSWTDLIGKTVVADHFLQPLAMFRYALHRQGIDAGRITLIDAGDVEAIDRAFREGQGNYVHLQGPAAQQMEKDRVGHVVAAVGQAIGPVAFSSLCASREWLATDMARAFLRAYRQARQRVIESPAAEIAAMESSFFPTIDREVLTRTIADYQRLGCWAPAVDISRASYETLLDVFEFNGLIRQRHPYELAVAPLPV